MESNATHSAIPSAHVVVDLIGDLDATLGTLIATTFSELASHGTSEIHVTTKHLSVASSDGVAALGRAAVAARAGGLAVALHAETRKMRAAFALARVVASPEGSEPHGRSRHLMLARHASTARRTVSTGAALLTT